MKVSADPGFYHKLYGAKTLRKPRIVYYKKDFIDYVLMMAMTALVIGFCFGFRHILAITGIALCAFLVITFAIRHGIGLQVPIIFREPEEFLYVWAYKLQNLKPMFFIALGLLLLENLLIRATPNLPHHVEWLRTGALCLFYVNFIGITIYRTISLVDHLRKREMVREILMQTPWKRAIKEKTNMTLEIVHAYVTGVLSHVVLLAAWYLVITYSSFSVIFLVPVCVLNVLTHKKWLRTTNSWFYRNHWLGHNSELQFVYFHGSHHDAIPSGLIAVSENGFLEGFFRHTIGWPNPFYNPLISFWYYTTEIAFDIDLHQYIPGVFPKLPAGSIERHQHSTHHYGPLEPYGFAFKLGDGDDYAWIPDEMRNAIKLDEQMGFKWDNPTFRRTKMLYEKYHNLNGRPQNHALADHVMEDHEEESQEEQAQ
jgi:hypothetical protein